MVTIAPDWWAEGEESAKTTASVKAQVERNLDQRREEARKRIAEEKRKRLAAMDRPVKSERYRTVVQVAERLGFKEETIRVWLRDGTLEGEYIRGQWRIADSAVTEFLIKERKRRA